MTKLSGQAVSRSPILGVFLLGLSFGNTPAHAACTQAGTEVTCFGTFDAADLDAVQDHSATGVETLILDSDTVANASGTNGFVLQQTFESQLDNPTDADLTIVTRPGVYIGRTGRASTLDPNGNEDADAIFLSNWGTGKSTIDFSGRIKSKVRALRLLSDQSQAGDTESVIVRSGSAIETGNTGIWVRRLEYTRSDLEVSIESGTTVESTESLAIHIGDRGVESTIGVNVAEGAEVKGKSTGIYLGAVSSELARFTVDGNVLGGPGPGINEFAGDLATGITVAAGAGGSLINISPTGTVSSEAGLAIRDLDDDPQFNEIEAQMRVNTQGTVTGDMRLGGNDDTVSILAGSVTGTIYGESGNDTVNLTGGTLDGDIHGDDVTASADDGDDAFNWTGGTWNSSFFGGNGSDTANISAESYDGTKHVLDGGDDVATADGWTDELTLSGVTATVNSGNIVNWEIATLDDAQIATGDGRLIVGAEEGTGLFLTNRSTFDGADAFALTGNLSIGAGTAFDTRGGGSGVYSISGNLLNAGTVNMRDGSAGDVLTAAGNYTGEDGSTILMDTYLGDDASPTDRLVVNGNTAGSTALHIANAGGQGARTIAGILVVDVEGNSEGSFALGNPDYTFEQTGEAAIIGGAYGYALRNVGGDWFLQSTLLPTEPAPAPYQPGTPVYETYAQNLLGFMRLPTLRQRVGNRYSATPALPSCMGEQLPAQGGKTITYSPCIEESAIWARIEGERSHVEPENSTAWVYEFDSSLWLFQAGLDLTVHENDDGKLIGGITAHYGEVSTDLSSFYGDGTIGTHGYGVGATLTWYGESGFYLDGQGQATWFDSDLDSDVLGRLSEDNDGFGYALSLEGGKRFSLNETWTLTPQAQIIYSSVDYADFTDPYGAEVSLEDGDSLRGRIGFSLDHEREWKSQKGDIRRSQVYGIVNLHQEFLDGTRTHVSGVNFNSALDDLTSEIGLGGSYNWGDDKYALYGEARASTGFNSFGDSHAVGGTVGFRIEF